jgi:hypothetical protein
MVKETLSQEAPSRDDSFVNAVGIFAAAESGDAERMRQIIKVKPELANINYPDPVSEQKPIHFPIGGFSPTVGSLARGLKPPSFRRFPFSRRSRALNPPTFSRWSFSSAHAKDTLRLCNFC